MNSTNLKVQAAAPVADTQKPLVKVFSPNGGEIYKVGVPVTISWDSQDNVNVVEHRILISRNGINGDYQLIVSGLPGNQESYVWTVSGPGTSRAAIKVRAFDAAGNAGFDTSDTPFIIMP